MNDFSNDSSCLALWRFEAADLLADAKGTNDYTAYNSPVAETVDFKEGSACLKLDHSQSQYLAIADSSLDDSFPLKLGDQAKLLVFSGWLKSISALEQVLFCKSDGTRQSLLVSIKSGKLEVQWGYNLGLSQETFPTHLRVPPTLWHYLYVMVDGLRRHLRIWLYQDSTKSWQACAYSPQNELWVGDGSWYLGGAPDGRTWDGLIDEAAIFNAAKTSRERRLISQGLFGSSSLLAPSLAAPLTPAGWRWNQSYWR